MESKYSTLKIKKQNASLLFGSKWKSKIFEIDDQRQALVQKSKGDAEKEELIPFSEIASVMILADAPGFERRESKKEETITSRPISESLASIPGFSLLSQLRLPSVKGVNSSSNLDKQRTRFVVELKGNAVTGAAPNKVILQANDPEEAQEWVKILADKVCTPGFTIVKEDIVDNIRQYYDLHPKETSSGKTTLGTGMSGEVKLIKRLSDQKEFAMKVVSISQMTNKQLQSLQNEIDILKSLDHPHIAKLYEVYVEHGMCVRMVLELCTGGELFDRLSKKRRLTEHYTSQLVHRMLGVLCYLHQNNIAHRDLKLENWLFRHKNDDDLDIVLIDFGLSHKYKNSEHMHSLVGTSYYCAPEVLEGDYEGNQEDLWSLGVITYMLLAGTAPFDGPNDDVILDNIRHARERMPKMSAGVWLNVSPEGKDFVQGLLTVDPKKRMTAEQALKHPWFVLTEAQRPPAEIDPTIFNSLKKFARYHELKRVAMEIVAFSLDHDEIKGLTEVFESLDTDGSGYITLEKLTAALKSKYNVKDTDIQEMFEALDEDRTGKVHVNEFVAACLQEKYHQDERYLYDAFMRLDLGNTGYITVADLKKLLGSAVTPARAERIILEAELNDHGNDHRISYQEFLRFMRTDGEEDVATTRTSLIEKSKKAGA